MKLGLIIKLAALCILLGLMFLLSEILYTRKNPFPLANTTFKISKYFAEQERPGVTFSIFILGTKIILNSNQSIYPNVVPKNFEISSQLLRDSWFKKEVVAYLKNIGGSIDYQMDYDQSLIYYDLAILANENGNTEQFSKLVEIAYYLRPTLSYWPVELANYYYRIGEKEKAIKILDKCKFLSEPSNHCTYFSEYINSNSQPFEPGFLKSEAYDFFDLQ